MLTSIVLLLRKNGFDFENGTAKLKIERDNKTYWSAYLKGSSLNRYIDTTFLFNPVGKDARCSNVLEFYAQDLTHYYYMTRNDDGSIYIHRELLEHPCMFDCSI